MQASRSSPVPRIHVDFELSRRDYFLTPSPPIEAKCASYYICFSPAGLSFLRVLPSLLPSSRRRVALIIRSLQIPHPAGGNRLRPGVLVVGLPASRSLARVPAAAERRRGLECCRHHSGHLVHSARARSVYADVLLCCFRSPLCVSFLVLRERCRSHCTLTPPAAGNARVLADVRAVVGDRSYTPTDARELASRLLYAVLYVVDVLEHHDHSAVFFLYSSLFVFFPLAAATRATWAR